jgi:hypothetical protein
MEQNRAEECTNRTPDRNIYVESVYDYYVSYGNGTVSEWVDALDYFEGERKKNL